MTIDRIESASRWLAAAAIAAGSSAAQSKLFQIDGTVPNKALATVAGVGDVDGDGLDDFATSVPNSDEGTWSAGEVRVYSGATALLHWKVFGDTPDEHLGAVRGVGDFDGDGAPDVGVGTIHVNEYPKPAYVRVLSGIDGATLFALDSPGAGASFGATFAAVGDVNADGILDLAAGAPTWAWPYLGKAYVISGADGTTLFSYSGTEHYEQFGSSVLGPGDLNGDGVADVIFGARGWSYFAGYLLAVSGATGHGIYVAHGPSGTTGTGHEFGRAIDLLGDLDDDGVNDLVVGDSGAGLCTNGAAYSISGADGTLIQELLPPSYASTEYLGMSVSSVGDLDGDGQRDALVGAPDPCPASFPSTNLGHALAYSTGTGALLFAIAGDGFHDRFGATVEGVGDVNGDGRPDLGVAAPTSNGYTTVSYGRIEIWSGTSLPLTSSTHAIDTSAGGSAALALEGGAQHAGKVYLVLGSGSGTAPGVAVGALTLPLNVDAYTLLTLSQPNQPPLAASLGVLDGLGEGACTLSLPAGAAAGLAGLTFHHAYVVLGPSSVDLASNAVPISLVP